MKKATPRVRQGEIIQTLTLTNLCRACGVHADWVIDLVDHGILEPQGRDLAEWTFHNWSITRVSIAWRLQRDLGLNLPGIALALDLMEERDRLAKRLAVAGDRDEVVETQATFATRIGVIRDLKGE